MRTRIKICGVTRPSDAALACGLGVDAIGIVFARRSRRRVTLAQARAVREAVDGLTALVALFVDQPSSEVREVIDAVRPDFLQFHGAESPSYCEQFAWPFLRALSHTEARERAPAFAAARGLVIDSHAPGELGGSGQPFDWFTFPMDIGSPVLLAGGLKPENVARAIRTTRPYGVDVASGVETAPGIKDAELLARFCNEVSRVDSHAEAP